MNLRHKVEHLLDLPPDRYSSAGAVDPSGKEYNNSALTAAIKARLWFLAQRILVDPVASRRLKPLDASKRVSDRDPDPGSQNMLDESVIQSNEFEPLFDSEDTDPLSECHDCLMDNECFKDDNLFDDEDLKQSEDMDDDLLMDGETILDDQGADEDLFWEDLDINQDVSYNSQPSVGHMFEREPFHEDQRHLLDAGMEDFLEECTDAVQDDMFAESHFGEICRQDNMLDDAEMGSVC